MHFHFIIAPRKKGQRLHIGIYLACGGGGVSSRVVIADRFSGASQISTYIELKDAAAAIIRLTKLATACVCMSVRRWMSVR